MNNEPERESHGIWRILPSMAITQLIGQSNFDFQILDCEHGGYDFKTLYEDIIACRAEGCRAYIRVSGLHKVEIQRCLDLGADGIVFPQLNDFNDFESATEMMQYAPQGVRGYNPFVSAGGYGFTKPTKRPECITIIETLQAVSEFDKILKIQNIDAFYIGVYDLSAQLGCIGVMDAPELTNIVNELIFKCVNAGKRVSVMVNDPKTYASFKNKGVSMFVHTVESFQIKKLFTELLTNLNNN